MKTISINKLKETVSEDAYPFVIGLVATVGFLMTALLTKVLEMEPSFQSFALVTTLFVVASTVYLSTGDE